MFLVIHCFMYLTCFVSCLCLVFVSLVFVLSLSFLSPARPQPLHSCRAASRKLPPQRRLGGEEGLHRSDQHQHHRHRQEQPEPRTCAHTRDTFSGTKLNRTDGGILLLSSMPGVSLKGITRSSVWMTNFVRLSAANLTHYWTSQPHVFWCTLRLYTQGPLVVTQQINILLTVLLTVISCWLLTPLSGHRKCMWSVCMSS